MALQILLNDMYKLIHCKEMGAEPGRRFLKQLAEKLKAVFVASLDEFVFFILFQQEQKIFARKGRLLACDQKCKLPIRLLGEISVFRNAEK